MTSTLARVLVLLSVCGAALSLTACGRASAGANYILDVDNTTGVPSYFTAPGSWDLKYSWDCAQQDSERQLDVNRFALTVKYADDGSADYEHPRVAAHGRKGGQTLHFAHGGVFALTVDTPCDWAVQALATNAKEGPA